MACWGYATSKGRSTIKDKDNGKRRCKKKQNGHSAKPQKVKKTPSLFNIN